MRVGSLGRDWRSSSPSQTCQSTTVAVAGGAMSGSVLFDDFDAVVAPHGQALVLPTV